MLLLYNKVIGPAPLEQRYTCTSGHPCRVQGVTGQYLGSMDRMTILETCGVASRVARVGTAWETNGNLLGANLATEWGGLAISAPGGTYRLCWCAASFRCSSHLDYRVDFGQMDIRGPAPQAQTRTCISGRFCEFAMLTGHALAVEDEVFVLDT